ncbi:MAG: hypothetical protein HFJ36_00460 [Clostridia bacterium]|nr:hypothetical protein [Clostridia bacterium]
MEILNNIWIAISTPNQQLVNILIVPICGILENILTMYLFLALLNIKATRKQKVLYVGSMSIISIINFIYVFNLLNPFINYISMILLITILFKTSILKSILASVSSAIIFALTGILISNPYIYFFNINKEILQNTVIYKLIYLLITYLIISSVIFLVKYRNIKINFLDDIELKNKYMILCNLCLGFLTLFVQAIITFYYIDTLPIIITFFNFIILLAYFVLSLFSLTRVMKLSSTTKKLHSVEEYNKSLHILHDNVRSFKHDFDNIVTTIGGYVRTNDMEGLKKYYIELEDDCQKVNNLYLLNPEIINNPRYL